MVRQTFEGTWEEIVQHASALAGHRVRLTVLDDAQKANGELPPGVSLADLMKDYIGKFSSDQPSDDARRAEEIFGEYVVEKHRKNQERRR
jgi:hypothetical protein